MWGATHRLFVGPAPGELRTVRAAGILDGFTLLPGLYQRDVFGGFIRYLEAVYGARLGEDLFVLDYDWRQPHTHSARQLAELVARVRGTTDDRVDLVGVCSGGPVIRTFLAGGWRDDPNDAFADPVLGPGPASVSRVIYMGAPLRGSISSLDYLQEGVTMVWGGYRNTPQPLNRGIPAMFDMLPHDGERILVDRVGASLELDHLDPKTWRELGLVGHDRNGLADDLARARRTHQLVASAESNHPPSIVIADRHSPTTTARAVLADGRLVFPCDQRAGDLERYRFAFAPGDGTIPAATMAAAPNQGPDGPWWIETSSHRNIASDPHVHPIVVEALLSPLKRLPREKYMWPRLAKPRASLDAR
ncbi:MAG: hypothetical protein JWO36_4986 [Myxococcales bacterium]|nr:hypothetical protein [Myxococcales bacterium]